jgi:hypothetical protein
MTNWNRFVDLYIHGVQDGIVADVGPNVGPSAARVACSGNWYNVFDTILIEDVARGIWARSSRYIGTDGVLGTGTPCASFPTMRLPVITSFLLLLTASIKLGG